MQQVMLDMDGVLTDFVRAAYSFHNKEYKDYPSGEWHVEKVMGLKPSEFWTFEEEFWAHMPWMPDGEQILKIIEDIVGIDNICLLTSPIRNSNSLSGKMEWIQRNIPRYSRKVLIGAAKDFCCGENRILIDDYDGNINKWRGPSFLVPRQWNTKYDQQENLISNLIEYLQFNYNQDRYKLHIGGKEAVVKKLCSSGLIHEVKVIAGDRMTERYNDKSELLVFDHELELIT